MIGSQNDGGGAALGSANGYGGAEGEGGGAQLKKGPWTAAEDAILADYVRKHGEGNWNAVQKNTGLNRCGKSCRLRWANHLRPNLKKGSFSPEEERLIIELHAQLGNKWARMAAQLPGRTDNEIKNYWNTRVKRRQRQGLPLYPPDIHPSYHNHQSHSQSPTPPLPATPSTSTSTSSFAFQLPANLSHHLGSPTVHLYHPNQHMPHMQQPLQSPNHGAFHMPYHHHHQLNNTSSALQSPNHQRTLAPHYSANATIQGHSSPLGSPHNHSYSTLPLLDSASNAAAGSDSNYYLRTPPSIQMPMRLKRPRCDDGDSSCNFDDNPPVVNPNVATTSYSMNPNFMFSPAITKNSLYTPAMSTSGSEMLPHHHHHPAFHSVSVDHNTLSSRMQDAHFDSGQFVYPLKQEELPSNQLLSQDGNPEIAYDAKVHENSTEHNSNDNNDNQPCASTRGNTTGLLEDLLEEAHALASSTETLRREEGYSNDHEHDDEKNVLAESNDAWCPSNSTTDVASVLKPKEEPAAEHHFQATRHDFSSKPINGSGWFSPDSGDVSNGQSSNVTDENLELEMHHVASLFSVDNTSDHRGRPQSSCSWDNMPGIC